MAQRTLVEPTSNLIHSVVSLTGEIGNDKSRQPRFNRQRKAALMAVKKQDRKLSRAPKKSTAGRRNSNTFSPDADYLARIALNLFADRHFSSVSIRDIGRTAKINSSMIYYHFADKDDLFRAAIESAIDEAFSLFAEHCKSENFENPVEGIVDWFDVHVTLYKRLRNVIKISLDCKGTVAGVKDSKNPITRFYRHERIILENLIHEGIQRGLFDKRVEPKTVATMISTMLDGMLARSIFLRDFDMHETVDAFKEAILLYLGLKKEHMRSARSGKRIAAVG